MPSFFRRDKNASKIPPVAPPPGQAAALSGGGDNPEDARRQLFSGVQWNSKESDSNSTAPPPSYRSTPGDPYGEASRDANRDALLGGFVPKDEPVKERKYGYEGRDGEADFDEEEEIEGIKQEMRGVKQESLASTRNALRIAREAEDTARGTLGRLGDQSERIANTERYLDIAKANNQRAEDKAEELKQLNKSIFRPVISWNKEAKREAYENKITNRHLRERDDREKARQDVIDTHQRLNNAANPGPQGYGNGSNALPRPGAIAARKEARSRFQFESTGSDDELEDELDDNLNETLEVTKNLKRLALAAGEELDSHNKRLVGITDKTGNLDTAILRNTEKLRRAGGKH